MLFSLLLLSHPFFLGCDQNLIVPWIENLTLTLVGHIRVSLHFWFAHSIGSIRTHSTMCTHCFVKPVKNNQTKNFKSTTLMLFVFHLLSGKTKFWVWRNLVSSNNFNVQLKVTLSSSSLLMPLGLSLLLLFSSLINTFSRFSSPS